MTHTSLAVLESKGFILVIHGSGQQPRYLLDILEKKLTTNKQTKIKLLVTPSEGGKIKIKNKGVEVKWPFFLKEASFPFAVN